MDMELAVTGDYGPGSTPFSNQKSLVDNLLTSQLREHIIHKSQSVIDQIGRLHLPVQNAKI